MLLKVAAGICLTYPGAKAYFAIKDFLCAQAAGEQRFQLLRVRFMTGEESIEGVFGLESRAEGPVGSLHLLVLEREGLELIGFVRLQALGNGKLEGASERIIVKWGIGSAQTAALDQGHARFKDQLAQRDDATIDGGYRPLNHARRGGRLGLLGARGHRKHEAPQEKPTTDGSAAHRNM